MKSLTLRWLGLILVLCLLPCLLTFALGAGKEQPQQPAATSGTNGGNVTWSYNTYTKTLTISGTGELGNFEYAWLDYQNEIKTVTINEGIDYIKDKVFDYHNALETVNLPASLLVMDWDAFEYCPALKKFTVKNGNPYFAADSTGLLYNGNKTVLYRCPQGITGSVTLASTATEIKERAFSKCTGITAISLPSALTTIGSEAFYDCTSLTSLALGPSVSNIGSFVFPVSDNFTKITVNVYNNHFSADSEGVLYNYAKSKVVRCPGGFQGTYTMPDTVTEISNEAFYQCNGLTSVALSENLTAIADTSFYSCRNLATVTFGSQVKSIGSSAFRSCVSLVEVDLPASVTELGNYAFRDCSALQRVTGGNIQTLGVSVFVSCKQLQEAPSLAAITELPNSTFSYCSALRSVELSDAVTSVGAYCFEGCEVLEFPPLWETLSSIGTYAFSQCSKIREVHFSDQLTYLGDYAFTKCYGLKKVSFGTGLTSTGNHTFEFAGVEEVDFGSTITTIGTCSFASCDFRALVIPPTVTKIQSEAFRAIWSMSAVSLPKTLTSIGNNAFYNCSDLSHVTYSGTQEEFTAVKVYSGNTDLTEALWHYSVDGSGITDHKTCFHDYFSCDICGAVFGYAYRSGAHSYAEGVCTRCNALECLTYNLSSTYMEVTITGVNTEVAMPSTLTIPETIEGCPVVTIGDNALRNQAGLQILILPANLRAINDYAFCNCDDLMLLSVPEGLQTIGNGAFQSCGSLLNIDLPNSLTTLGNSAFDSCGTMLWADLGNGIQSLGDYAFLSCSNLVSIHLGKPTAVGYRAFYGCDLLTHVSYGGNSTDWAEISFEEENAPLQSAHRHDLCQESPVNYFVICGGICARCDFCDGPIRYMEGGGTGHWFEEGFCQVCGVPEYLTYTVHPTDCTVTVTGFDGSVSEVVIPDTIDGFPVTDIGSYAFSGSVGLQKVTLGNNVKTVASGAFRNCSALTEVVLGESVETLGSSAFYDCDALSSIHLPDGVKSLSSYAFYDCDGLVSVTGGSNVSSIGGYTFYDCDSLAEVDPLASAKSLGNYAFWHCDSLREIVLSDALNLVPEFCFSDSDQLASVTFGSGLKMIDTHAFYDCDGLLSVRLPEGIMTVGEYAFSSCDALNYVHTGGLPQIEGNTFNQCSALKILDVSGAENIMWYAFTSCSALEEITFGPKLRYCYPYAFEYCENVTKMHISDLAAWCAVLTSPRWDIYLSRSDLYLNGELITNLEIPQGVTTIGDYAFEGCDHIASITLPEGLQTIGSAAFYRCSGIEGIYIPETVTELGPYAFGYCKNLTSVRGMLELTEISEGVFTECDALRSIWLPHTVTSVGAAAFAHCDQLVFVCLQDRVTSIGEMAFWECDSLNHILFGGSQSAWNSIKVGESNPLLTIVTVHTKCSGTEIVWKEFLGETYAHCTVCNTDLTEKPRCFHDEMRLYDEKEPTCTEPGYTGDVWCLVCGECVERGQVIEPLNHPSTRLDGRVEPTCTEPGYTGDTWCNYCDAYVIYGETIAPLNHPVQEWIGVCDPTCTGYGYSGDLLCLTCGTYLEQGQEIPPLGHSDTYLAGDYAPTCTEPGYTGDERCGVCHEIVTPGQAIDPLGHRYENGACIYCGLPGAVEIPFEDVKESDYYANPVLWAVQEGVTNGTSPTEFSPEDPCTRGQIVTFLWRSFGSPEPTKTENPFVDVSSNMYYYKAVLWAVEQGITTGVSKTEFEPDATCTRGQVATFLWRACKKPAPESGENPFSDVDSNMYYYQPILWAVEEGITNGTGGGKFSPEESCTRGQIVTFLYRALAE